MTSPHDIPSLNQSKRFATIALISALASWIALMILAKFVPDYVWLIHIFMLSAEAGVVGGLADWYAITVLFRNPFGNLPLPRLLREHTAIIPRNKARIAESMGRFVQENFLSPAIVRRSLQQTDVTLYVGDWLATAKNSQMVVEAVQLGVPRIFEFMGEEQISHFVQTNSVQWIKNTKINQITSELLKAVLDNDFHQDVLQRGLDLAHAWVKAHPEQTYLITQRLFDELGVGRLARGATFLGIDVQQRTINAFIEKVEQLLADANHPYRINLENQARYLMAQLQHEDSVVSQRLNQMKNDLLDSPQLLDFISRSISIVTQAISNDLQQKDSGIAQNLHAAVMQVGRSIQHNEAVRRVFNQRLLEIAVQLSSDYSDKVIGFISQRIHEWDSTEMIGKIENEVGGDLHMIRVNGVVVGAAIGLVLGVIRAVVGG